jgi:hypothetical protein
MSDTFIEVVIPKGWTAFINDKRCVGYQEFKEGGKAKTKLTLITKPTKAELLAELSKQGITYAS